MGLKENIEFDADTPVFNKVAEQIKLEAQALRFNSKRRCAPMLGAFSRPIVSRAEPYREPSWAPCHEPCREPRRETK